MNCLSALRRRSSFTMHTQNSQHPIIFFSLRMLCETLFLFLFVRFVCRTPRQKLVIHRARSESQCDCHHGIALVGSLAVGNRETGITQCGEWNSDNHNGECLNSNENKPFWVCWESLVLWAEMVWHINQISRIYTQCTRHRQKCSNAKMEKVGNSIILFVRCSGGHIFSDPFELSATHVNANWSPKNERKFISFRISNFELTMDDRSIGFHKLTIFECFDASCRVQMAYLMQCSPFLSLRFISFSLFVCSTLGRRNGWRFTFNCLSSIYWFRFKAEFGVRCISPCFFFVVLEKMKYDKSNLSHSHTLFFQKPTTRMGRTKQWSESETERTKNEMTWRKGPFYFHSFVVLGFFIENTLFPFAYVFFPSLSLIQ